MGKKNRSNKYNRYSCFEDSIISLVKNEIKKSLSRDAVIDCWEEYDFGNSSIKLSNIHRDYCHIFSQIDVIASYYNIEDYTENSDGSTTEYGLTESYYSEDLEKRYREYIKKNFESEFNQHKNDVPYIKALILKAVKAVIVLMENPSNSNSPNKVEPVDLANNSDFANNDKNCV